MLAAVLVARYFRKGGGIAMLRMMSKPIPEHHAGKSSPYAPRDGFRIKAKRHVVRR
jgi:hypothetical protein